MVSSLRRSLIVKHMPFLFAQLALVPVYSVRIYLGPGEHTLELYGVKPNNPFDDALPATVVLCPWEEKHMIGQKSLLFGLGVGPTDVVMSNRHIAMS